ncbi:MAG: hypothetical protein R3F20_02935 [Planctomycetota bacterium]
MRSFATTLALLVMAGALSAQAALYTSTEYFIVPNYREGISGNVSWDNFVFVDAIGTPHITTWDNISQSGNGPFANGAYFPDGDYNLEAVWFGVSFNNGVTGGHAHIQATGGNPGAYDRPHYNGTPDQLQGWRITRNDGAPFIFVAVDYLNTPVSLLVGTSYTSGYPSTCQWDVHDPTSAGLLIGDANWQTLNLFDLPTPPMLPPGPGQPLLPGLAVMNVNSATNANGSPVNDPCGDWNGPFFTSLGSTTNLSFTFNGQPQQPIVVLGSITLNPGAAVFAPIGQVDIGLTNPMAPFIPNGLFIVADGTQPDFFNSLFRTNSAGTATMTFSNPGFPAGTVVALQALIYNTTATVANLSNAVEVTFQ